MPSQQQNHHTFQTNMQHQAPLVQGASSGYNSVYKITPPSSQGTNSAYNSVYKTSPPSSQETNSAYNSVYKTSSLSSVTPWQSWETFSGHSIQPVPLGMQTVPQDQVHTGTFSSVPPTGRRKALIIGINYKGTRAELRGCVNDAKNIKKLLLEHGFQDDSTHMVMLVDEGSSTRKNGNLPTKANIIRGMQWLVQGASKGDVLFFHFSGHGAQTPDETGHEADGFNETILPLDYQRAGQITDDVIWNILVWPLTSGVRLTAIMDCCHSGTGLDLPYEFKFQTGRWTEEVNPAHSCGDVIQFSGCEDSQTSADAYEMKQAGGAMTQSFIAAYRQNPMATYPDFVRLIHENLRRRKFKQRPQLTTSQTFDVQSRVFSFVDGIEPNKNREVGRLKRQHLRPAKKGKKNLLSLLFS